VPLGCQTSPARRVENEQDVIALGSPLREPKRLMFGSVTRLDGQTARTDVRLPYGGAGGPVFGRDGQLLGLTSLVEDDRDRRDHDTLLVQATALCETIASLSSAAAEPAPENVRLPVEPTQRYPPDALETEAQRRIGSLNPYRISSSDFDLAFITPVMLAGAQMLSTGTARRVPSREPSASAPLEDFGRWSDYVSDFRPVLLVRITPKLVEGFWTKVARGAASTQGLALPPIKHFKPGFSRMRVFCGDVEVRPIHPLTIEQQLSDNEAIIEGLYVFDPGALGPHCASVKVSLASEKEPSRDDIRTVEPKILEQIWNDFTSYRNLPPTP
jgi:hypothetical protein